MVDTEFRSTCALMGVSAKVEEKASGGKSVGPKLIIPIRIK